MLKNKNLIRSAGFINGEWIGAEQANRFDVNNPYSQKLICTLPEMGKYETQSAIEAATDTLRLSVDCWIGILIK